MSKIAITGNDNGSGTFTIASPNSDTDRTLTLPDASGTAIYADSVGNVKVDGSLGVGTFPLRGALHIFDDNSDIEMDTVGSGQLHIDGNGWGFGIALNSSGAQIYTNSASRDLIFGTNETEQARINGAGLLKFNSGFGSVAGAYAVRAWCKWNMASTQTILGSGGVSSITDAGVGRTDINFLETMPDINYAATYTIGNNVAEWWTGPFTTTSVRCNVYTGSAYTDQNNNSCIVAR